MSVGLYLDVHVPASITRGLVLRGVDVLTAQIDGTTEWKDPDLLDRATELGRVLFSQDEDLLAEATKRQRSGQHFGGVQIDSVFRYSAHPNGEHVIIYKETVIILGHDLWRRRFNADPNIIGQPALSLSQFWPAGYPLAERRVSIPQRRCGMKDRRNVQATGLVCS